MSKIEFNPEARKTKLFEGPYASREALIEACEIVTPNHAAWAQYQTFKEECGVSVAGRIQTTAYNDDLLKRRFATLTTELKNPEGAAAPVKFVTDFLQGVMYETPDRPYKILSVATTRDNLFFAVDKVMPDLKAQVTRFIPDSDAVEIFNDVVETNEKISGRLIHTDHFAGLTANAAIIDPALMYEDKKALRCLFSDIEKTGAKYIVIHDLMANTDPNGAEQWYGQRYSGGIIPLRIPARNEIDEILAQAGYRTVLTDRGAEPTVTDAVYRGQVEKVQNLLALRM